MQQSPAQTAFEFLDVKDPEYGKKVRVHAAKKNHHRRRGTHVRRNWYREAHQGFRLSVGGATGVHSSSLDLSKLAGRRNSDYTPSDLTEWQGLNSERVTVSLSVVAEDDAVANRNQRDWSNTMRPWSPATSRTSLGEFGQRLSKLDYRDQGLIRWSDCIGLPVNRNMSVTQLMQATGSSPDALPQILHIPERSGINSLKDWTYPALAEGPLSMQAALYHLAVWSRLSKGKPLTPTLLADRGHLTRRVNTTLQDPVTAIKDELVYAVISFMLVEHSSWDTAAFHTHLQGLMQVIDFRGGLESLNHSMSLCAAVAFAEFGMARPPSLATVQRTFGSGIRANSQKGSLQQFLTMLHEQSGRRRDQLTRSIRMLGSRMAQPPKPHQSVLAVDSTLLQLLAAEDNNSVVAQVRLNCKMASLLYINNALAELEQSIPSRTAFLDQILRYAAQSSLHRELGAILLMSGFLRNLVADDLPRLWRVVRAMRLVNNLRPATRHLLHNVLLQQLRLDSVDDATQQLRDIKSLTAMIEADTR